MFQSALRSAARVRRLPLTTTTTTTTSALACSWLHTGGVRRFAAGDESTKATEMLFSFSSPTTVKFDNEVVKEVYVPAVSGIMGVMANTEPTVAQLRPGMVTVVTKPKNDEASTKHKFFVPGGFAIMTKESTFSISAPEIVNIDDLDPEAVNNGLTQAEADLAKAQDDREKAVAQITKETFFYMKAAVESNAAAKH